MIADLSSAPKTTFSTIRKQRTLKFLISRKLEVARLKAFRTDNLTKWSVGYRCPGRNSELNDSYLQILLCTLAGVTINAVCRLQYTLWLSLACLSHFSLRPSSSTVCCLDTARTDLSSSQTTIVRLNDVDPSPSPRTMDWVWKTLADP